MKEDQIMSLTTEEVMKALKCSRSWLYKNETQARLGAYKQGNLLRWPLDNIIRYQQENKVVRESNHQNVETKKYNSKRVASKHNLW